MTKNCTLAGLLLLFAASTTPVGTSAQEPVPAGASASPAAAEARPARVRPTGAPSGGATGAPGQPAGGPDGKPVVPGKEGEKAGETPKTDATKPEPPKTTARPAKPATPPNPEELKIQPDASGRVRFNFQGQPWLDVLEWLAKISQLSLDWQEVPGDFLNLRTQRSYTVEEARDLINRHLLDRGFTMLLHGEILSVVNIKKLDPSLVPRVTPTTLEERQPHEFVKVSFPLDSLMAETATEELKPMLSPNGKLVALKATNRLEALDAVANLREIRDILAHEQTQTGRKRLVQQFTLQYTRAPEVLEQLMELLGMEKKKASSEPMNPQQMQQQMMMQQQMQQMQQQGGGKPPAPKQGSNVHLVVNPRENSIVATAPADQMAIIDEAIKLIDVPASRSQSLLNNVNRMQIYRLASIDPEPIVKLLQEIGDLDPTTKLQVDKKSKSIIAEGSLADHMTIRMLVKKLDGTDRKFEVIKLRRLEADYVAGSIDFMMGGEKKKSQTNSNRYYSFFDAYGSGDRNSGEDESRKFRVDADTEHNRLLLWANAVELEEVVHLLEKLGEIPAEGGNRSTRRVIDNVPPEEVEQLIERLRRAWPSIRPNPLQMPPLQAPQTGPGAREPSLDVPSRQPPAIRKLPDVQTPPVEKSTQLPQKNPPEKAQASARLLRLVQVAEEKPLTESEFDAAVKAAAKGDGDAPPLAPPPVRIGRDIDGRMTISSPDTTALDKMEELLIEIAPPRRDYKIFKMKYKSTWAYGVALNLKEFFDEKEKSDKPTRNPFYYDFGMSNNNKTEDGRRLSKRRPLKFISDSDSNSILVTGADPNQLRIIEELIDLYDMPESKESASIRMTKIVSLEYSKARVVADAVKEVYRDLLSANDPALQGNQKDEKKKSPDAMFTYITNLGGDDKKPDTPMKFKGLLSIGVDELSNTLVVSSSESLLENVTKTIQALDQAARPTVPGLHVLKIDRNINVGDLQKRLKSLVTKPPPPNPQQQRNQQQQGQQPQQNFEPPPADSTIIIDNN